MEAHITVVVAGPVSHEDSRVATTRVIKSALKAHVPDSILKRKKAGIPVPYSAWLQGPLRNRVGDLILDREARTRKYFNRSEVEKLMEHHTTSGTRATEVFSLAILELWHQ